MLITVVLMLSVPTPLVATPVPVTRATVGMDTCVWVSSGLCSSDSVVVKRGAPSETENTLDH